MKNGPSKLKQLVINEEIKRETVIPAEARSGLRGDYCGGGDGLSDFRKPGRNRLPP
jgi:hypothetical protein